MNNELRIRLYDWVSCVYIGIVIDGLFKSNKSEWYQSYWNEV